MEIARGGCCPQRIVLHRTVRASARVSHDGGVSARAHRKRSRVCPHALSSRRRDTHEACIGFQARVLPRVQAGVGARFGCLALSFTRLSAGESAAKATALSGNTLAEEDITDARTT